MVSTLVSYSVRNVSCFCYDFDELPDLHTKRGELNKRQHVVS